MPKLLYPGYFPFCIQNGIIGNQVFSLAEVMEIYWKVKVWEVSLIVSGNAIVYTISYPISINQSFLVYSNYSDSSYLYCRKKPFTPDASWNGGYLSTLFAGRVNKIVNNNSNYGIVSLVSSPSFDSLTYNIDPYGVLNMRIVFPVVDLLETYYTATLLNKEVSARIFVTDGTSIYEPPLTDMVNIDYFFLSCQPQEYWDYS